MSLHLILGNSGGGKTHTLYETMIREACAFPDRSFLVIVPEQFTLETQRELTAMHPGGSLCNLDILSFQRLGYRLLEEAGIDQREVLDDTGKNFILRRIAEEHRDELKVFGARLDRMDMIDEIKSFLSELMQYNLTPEDLDRMIAEARHTSLKWKLEDIRLLYDAFLKEIEGKALTAEGLLTQTGHLAADSAFIKDCVIGLDGYTGFTPVQNELLSTLMQSARDLYVTVTIDADRKTAQTGAGSGEKSAKNTCRAAQSMLESMIRKGPMTDLFWLSRRTIRQLVQTAEENGVWIRDPVVCSGGADCRFREAPQLFHLEQHLFRKNAGGDSVYAFRADEERQVTVIACTEPRDELELCLRQIKHTVLTQGGSYGDFAIMTGDLSRYENFAPELFSTCEVPYFLDRTRRLDAHPFPQAIRSLLQILSDDFSYRSVFEFLRSGFGPLTDDETDRLENYVLAAGIRGCSAWKKTWKRNPLRLTSEELEGVNALRIKFCEDLLPLRETFRDRNADIREKTLALYRYLTRQNAEEKLSQRAQQFRERNDPVRAREEEQIYPLTMQLLEKLTDVLGSAKAGAQEYRELLEAGFSAVTLRVAPPRGNTVLFGDMERTRLNHVKTLFLIGANDGVIPGVGSEGGILSEFERQFLKDAGEELAYSAREQALLQNFYLYQNLTKPTHSLYITYAMRGSDGTALRRSALIAAVEKLYAQPVTQEMPAGELITAEASLTDFACQIREIADARETDGVFSDPPALWKALGSYYEKTDVLGTIAERILQAACSTNSDSRLQPETAQSLYGQVIRGSVSRLEKQAACAFSHFAAYGLRLQERLIASFEPEDMGNLLHDAVRNYTARVCETGKTFHNLTEAQIDHDAQLAIDMAIADREETAMFENASDRQISERLRRVFYRTVHVMTEQVQAGAFEPVSTEVPFHVLWDLENGRKMQLNGRIDRVDAAQVNLQGIRPRAAEAQEAAEGCAAFDLAVRIVDYKSSKKEFRPEELYEGLSLQLPLYLEAVTEEVHAMPAGMFYYAMLDPVLDELPDETPQEHADRIRRQLRLSGPVNAHPEALKAMDDLEPGEESAVVKIKRNKDGSLAKYSDVLPQTDFAMLPRFAKKKALEIGNAIAQGDIRVSPFRSGRYTACDYCPYLSVCGFDAKRPDYRYRNSDMKKEEALQRMREELNDES